MSKSIKKLGLAAAFTVGASFAAQAQDIGFYLEGNVGVAMPNDVKTAPFTGTLGGSNVSNFVSTLEMDRSTTRGFELGVRINNSFRVGVGRQAYTLTPNNITASGVVNGTAVNGIQDNLSGARKVSADVNTTSVNAYYDFNDFAGFRPFVGFGLGRTEFEGGLSGAAALLNVGARYSLTENMYVGAKITHIQSRNFDNTNRIQLQPVSANLASLIVGFEF